MLCLFPRLISTINNSDNNSEVNNGAQKESAHRKHPGVDQLSVHPRELITLVNRFSDITENPGP
jgi:hypothetical protein